MISGGLEPCPKISGAQLEINNLQVWMCSLEVEMLAVGGGSGPPLPCFKPDQNGELNLTWTFYFWLGV